MVRPRPPIRCVALFAAAAVPAAAAIPAIAQPPASLSLSDAEKAELLAGDTETSVASARSGLGGEGHVERQIHGEVGGFVGSDGARGAFGTAAIPLGAGAGANVSFESSRFGRPR